MERKSNNPELSKQDKMALVRDVMVRFPDYKRFGYNRKIIDLIEIRTTEKDKDDNITKRGIILTDNDINRCIKDIEKQWQEDDTVKYSKSKILDMLTGLYESNDAKIKDKRMISQDIAKIEGHYKIDLTINTANIPEDKKENLKKIFGDRAEKKKKED